MFWRPVECCPTGDKNEKGSYVDERQPYTVKFEEFLQRSAEDGFHHSAGEFTVDFLKAGDKLADFALPSDNHYLLKGVQMAHRLGAPRIDVVIGRYSTSLKFFSAQGRTVPTVLEISSALKTLWVTKTHCFTTLSSASTALSLDQRSRPG